MFAKKKPLFTNQKKSFSKHRTGGVSLLEVLVVISLLSILAYLFISEIHKRILEERLKETAESLAGELNYIKSLAPISAEPPCFCYKEGNKEFIFFMDTNRNKNLDESDKILKSMKIEKPIEVANITNDNKLLCPRSVCFDRRGEIRSSGSLGHTIVLGNTYNQTVEIKISRTGRIRIQ